MLRHLTILFFLLVFLLPACGKKEPVGGFTLATLKGPSSMGMIRLIDSLYRSDSASVKVKIFNEPLQVRKMMIEGSADFAVLPSNMAAIVYNKGLDYRLAAIPVWGTLYMVGRDTSLLHWEDLKGKRVFVMARGMTPDVLFRYLLRKNGLNPDADLILDYSFPTHIDLANAVNAGKADPAVISEPLVSLAIKNNKNLRRIFSLNEEWSRHEGIPIAETAFMVKNNILLKDRKLVDQILSGYEASTNWVNQNPDSAARLIVKYGIMPDYDAALSSILRLNLKFVRAGTMKKEIDAYYEVFYRMNPDIIGGKIPDEDFIY